MNPGFHLSCDENLSKGWGPPLITPGESETVWDDCISSVRVAPGWEAHLYEHPNFGGWDQIVLEDVLDLGQVLGPCDETLDDCVSSIRVFPR